MIDIKNIGKNLKDRFADFTPERVRETGTVVYCGDGIVKIEGLSKVKYNELIEFSSGGTGMALNLEKDSVGAAVLSGGDDILCGETVYSTGRTVEVPVGKAMLGRVVNPLGQPIDDAGIIESSGCRAAEFPAPAIMNRAKVSRPLYTGILSLDSMIPIGKGQRELIIGDRQTGKTAIAVDTILNQKGKDVYCIYVAIGQKASTVSNIVKVLKQHGAMEYTCVVCSTADDPAPLQYLAPYSGCAIAEEFMYSGGDALIVYDDLTKHAVSYRTMSLLLKRPAGREAYPGDVFYLHSRLLERAASLSADCGGGSLTALPIIETQAGDISAYIPTNVISITDGQIYLESELFNAGIRPAVNVGLSVSRVGGSAQLKSMRQVSGQLRLSLAQYRELLIFSQFGSDLDSSTREILATGDKITETLKQAQFKTYTPEQMLILLILAQSHVIDDIKVKSMRAFNRGVLEHIAAACPEISGVLNTALDSGITEEIKDEIIEAAQNYRALFAGGVL